MILLCLMYLTCGIGVALAVGSHTTLFSGVRAIVTVSVIALWPFVLLTLILALSKMILEISSGRRL